MKPGARSSLAAAAASLLLASEAHAGFKICNFGGRSAFMTMAFRSGSAFQSKGWWEIPAGGGCVATIEGPLRNRYYYLHGQDAEGMFVSGNYLFCVKTTPSFEIADAQTSCSGASAERRGFIQIDTGEAKDFTYNIVERFPLGSGGGEEGAAHCAAGFQTLATSASAEPDPSGLGCPPWTSEPSRFTVDPHGTSAAPW